MKKRIITCITLTMLLLTSCVKQTAAMWSMTHWEATTHTNNTPDVQESSAGLTVKDIYELDLGETPARWTDGSLEIAKSLYTGFQPAAVKMDEKWKKALYSDAYDLLIVRDANNNMYDVFHGESMVSVPMTLGFPHENNVTIKFADINNDGKDELYIGEYITGTSYENVIEIEPFAVITDSYSVVEINKLLKGYKVTSVENDNDNLIITAEFTMLDDKKLTYRFAVSSSDIELSETEDMDVVRIDTIVSENDEGYAVSYDIWFRLASSGKDNVYVNMNIPSEYDEELNHYCPEGNITFDYLVGHPADWG